MTSKEAAQRHAELMLIAVIAAQVNPNNQFAGSQAECNPVTVGSAVTVGSVAYPYDGAFPQLGGVNVLQPPLPECPVPNGFGIM